MRFAKVDLNLFRVFDTIYSQGSLTRAGEVLHVTQPAVSNALARLRELYGDPLFVRAAGAMKPTPLAERLIDDVRKALTLMRTSIDTVDNFDPRSSERQFRLIMGDLQEATVMPMLLAGLQATAPQVTIAVQRLQRSALPSRLGSGQAHFALDAVAPVDPQLFHLRLFADRYVCAVRRDHPRIGGSLTLQQYLAEGHIHPSSRLRGLGHVDLGLRQLGLQRRIVLRTQHYLHTPLVAAATHLLLSVPRTLVQRHNLNLVALPFEVEPLQSYLIWHRSIDADAGCVWLRERLKEVCA